MLQCIDLLRELFNTMFGNGNLAEKNEKKV